MRDVQQNTLSTITPLRFRFFRTSILQNRLHAMCSRFLLWKL